MFGTLRAGKTTDDGANNDGSRDGSFKPAGGLDLMDARGYDKDAEDAGGCGKCVTCMQTKIDGMKRICVEVQLAEVAEESGVHNTFIKAGEYRVTVPERLIPEGLDNLQAPFVALRKQRITVFYRLDTIEKEVCTAPCVTLHFCSGLRASIHTVTLTLRANAVLTLCAGRRVGGVG
jgi:hypothetical protein